MMVNLFVDLLVISFVEISLFRLVRTCCADKPVVEARLPTLVTNEPLGIVMPCHLLSS